MAFHRPWIRDRDPIAIAVEIIGGTKSSRIHVAVGDLELMQGEVVCPVDPELVLL